MARPNSEQFHYADRWRPVAGTAFRRRLAAKRFESQWRSRARPMVRRIDLFLGDTPAPIGQIQYLTAHELELRVYGEIHVAP